jgi:mono/diheme cytochrome c family protein
MQPLIATILATLQTPAMRGIKRTSQEVLVCRQVCWPQKGTRMHEKAWRFLPFLCLLVPFCGYPLCSARAEDAPAKRPADGKDAESIAFFEKQVLPILRANCFECHGGGAKVQSAFRLTSREGLLKGGERAPAVSLDKPAESVLLDAINYRDLEMPPKGKLPPAQIEILTRWVKSGVPWTPGKDFTKTSADDSPRKGPPKVTDETKRFWSFQPIQRPPVPPVKQTAWVRSPIDAFILHRLEKEGFRPAPPAEKIPLLRRATYDLTGLPPTPAEVDAFLADNSPQAFEKVVDRLLQSPRYGERWGRHWLDLVRFAETNSFERDAVKPEAWRFRDYVIQSLNDDKPYDRFVLEQLAGDELEPVTAESLIATGFYRLGPWDDEPTDRLQARYDELDDIVATTGQVFLGLTLNCARCHDHKLDPIPQADYYRLLAFFHGVTPFGVGKEAELKHILAPLPGQPGKKALCVTEAGVKPPETYVLIRGNAHVRGTKVEPGFPQVLSPPRPDISVPDRAKSSGRRLALARWIVSPNNPLTARVMANRIWQYHFGRGIVRSPSNFGQIGDRPTHPELLDWLASELVQRGWRLKAMHKLIMLSSAYQMSSVAGSLRDRSRSHETSGAAHVRSLTTSATKDSQPRSDRTTLARDPQNDLFWRFDMRRLSAEEIRDSILAANGRLNLKMGGPGFYHAISRDVLAGQSRPGDGWGKSPPQEQARRSIYIHVKRSLITPILETFDAADADSSCPVRFTTTQATQALGMLNGDFLNDQAKVFAARLIKEAGPEPTAQVRLALRLATSREPSPPEIARGVRLMERLQQEDGLNPAAALEQFCLMVYNMNEFIYVD